MTDLVTMFNSECYGDPHNDDDNGMSALDFAGAIGLAETFLDDKQNQHFDNVEMLFDCDEDTHEKAEMISLKSRNNEQNIPNFESYVMKKCGLLGK